MTTPRPHRVMPPLPVRATAVLLVVCVGLGVVWWVVRPDGSAPGSPDRARVEALLAAVSVVPERSRVPGYERDCSGTAACVFGPAWSDATSAPGAGNGCPTRQDVLARDLVGARPDPGRPCGLTGGILVDPYTGSVVDVARVGARGVHVDHVYPLSAAWDLGAADWPQDRRAAFANDVDRNLVAVAGTVNTRKSDATPADWMPPDPRRHCFYAARYLTAAVAYGLAVTDDDEAALSTAVRRCPRNGSG